MAIVFPRAMPVEGPSEQVFEPREVSYMAPDNAGRLGAIAAGFPLWQAEWSLGRFGQKLSDEWRAFLTSLNGSARLFLGHEFGREFPREYPDGFAGLGWSGEAATWSQSVLAGQALLSLTGLAAGLKITAGDYVGFKWTTGGVARRSLVRSLETVTASGGGAVSNLAIYPPVPTVTPGGAVAYMNRPECLMRIDTQRSQVTAMDRRKVAGARIVAVQDLLP